MKVYIRKYNSWFGPYQLAEKLCFWAEDIEDEYGFKRKPDWVHDFGEWLAHGNITPETPVGEVTDWNKDRPHTFLYKFLLWVDSVKRKIPRAYVNIDRWDTWNMDSTLAEIIVPMLKQLRDTKHGSPIVDMEDVPEHMRTTSTEEYDYQQTFDFYNEDEYVEHYQYNIHDRWNWVLNEMIFAFEHLLDDTWEDKYRTGEHQLLWEKLPDGTSKMIYGPDNTYKCDYDGIQKVEDRMKNGFRLFGKYYRGLWD